MHVQQLVPVPKAAGQLATCMQVDPTYEPSQQGGQGHGTCERPPSLMNICPFVQRFMSMRNGWAWTWRWRGCELQQRPSSLRVLINLLLSPLVQELLWIAREGLKAPLPKDWKPWCACCSCTRLQERRSRGSCPPDS